MLSLLFSFYINKMEGQNFTVGSGMFRSIGLTLWMSFGWTKSPSGQFLLIMGLGPVRPYKACHSYWIFKPQSTSTILWVSNFSYVSTFYVWKLNNNYNCCWMLFLSLLYVSYGMWILKYKLYEQLVMLCRNPSFLPLWGSLKIGGNLGCKFRH